MKNKVLLFFALVVPGHGLLREVGNLVHVRKRGQITVHVHIAALEHRIFMQDRRSLFTRCIAVRVKLAVANADHDLVLCRPDHRVGVPFVMKI